MKTTFKLNTATRSWGRVKGWNSTSDLEDTVRDTLRFNPEQKPALRDAVSAELNAARENLARVENQWQANPPKRGKSRTRSGNALIARFERAHNKVRSLASALETLDAA